MGHGGDGFMALLAAVGPYVNELVYQPTFHLFMDLPTEIRCLIYDQYFLDDTKPVACRHWPCLKFTPAYLDSIKHKRTTSPFLPNLCLTNKALRCELLPCLLGVAQVEFDDPKSIGLVLILLSPSKSGVEVGSAIRKVSLEYLNSQRKGLLLESNENSQRSSRKLAKYSSQMYGFVMPYLPRLRELSITFYAPIMVMTSSWNDHPRGSLRALPIQDHLGELKVEKIVALAELQKLSITGFGGVCNRTDQITRNGNAVINEGKADNLAAILGFGRKVKEGFKAKGQNVVVTVRLQWTPSDHMEETFT
jgi:hypothetical protein